MAVGDQANAAGYPLVPDSGEAGRVRWGAREINRTRDLVAALRLLIPTSKPGFRAAAGITVSSSNPTGGANGDIWFKVVG